MKAIIPAAGIGERLKPHTLNRPKVMVSVAGKPILEHISTSLLMPDLTKYRLLSDIKKNRSFRISMKNSRGNFIFRFRKK